MTSPVNAIRLCRWGRRTFEWKLFYQITRSITVEVFFKMWYKVTVHLIKHLESEKNTSWYHYWCCDMVNWIIESYLVCRCSFHSNSQWSQALSLSLSLSLYIYIYIYMMCYKCAHVYMRVCVFIVSHAQTCLPLDYLLVNSNHVSRQCHAILMFSHGITGQFDFIQYINVLLKERRNSSALVM